MKIFRYKEVARLNFIGFEDELNNDATSYYNTKFKLQNNNEINTKLLRFGANAQASAGRLPRASAASWLGVWGRLGSAPRASENRSVLNLALKADHLT